MGAAQKELRVLPDASVAGGFDFFYRTEYRSVMALAIVLTRDRPAAEELTQDAFLAALKQWGRVGGMENPGAWVRSVVANRAVSRFRRQMSEVRALASIGVQRGAPAMQIAESIDIWREVRALPRRQAQVIALVYANDLSRREVANILGCSEETVKTHLDRARRTLRSRLPGGRADVH